MAVFCALSPPLRAGVSIAIFDPVEGFLHTQVHVNRQNRFCAHSLAQVHELIRAHLVRVLIGPNNVREIFAIFAWSDGVLPAIGRSKATPGVTDCGGLEILDRLQHVRPESAVVQSALGKQTDHIQGNIAGARQGHLEDGVFHRSVGRDLEGQLFPFGADIAQDGREHLIALVIQQAHFYPRCGLTLQMD